MILASIWQNVDNCYNEAKRYISMTDFMRKSNGAYMSALKKGWTKDYIWLYNKKRVLRPQEGELLLF